MVVTIGIFRPVSKPCFVTFLVFELIVNLWVADVSNFANLGFLVKMSLHFDKCQDGWGGCFRSYRNKKDVCVQGFILTAGFFSSQCEMWTWDELVCTLPKTNVTPFKKNAGNPNRNRLFQRSIFRGWYASPCNPLMSQKFCSNCFLDWQQWCNYNEIIETNILYSAILVLPEVNSFWSIRWTWYFWWQKPLMKKACPTRKCFAKLSSSVWLVCVKTCMIQKGWNPSFWNNESSYEFWRWFMQISWKPHITSFCLRDLHVFQISFTSFCEERPFLWQAFYLFYFG